MTQLAICFLLVASFCSIRWFPVIQAVRRVIYDWPILPWRFHETGLMCFHFQILNHRNMYFISLFWRSIRIFHIFLCQFDYRPLLIQLGPDSQADDAQEAYRLAVQAADDILLAGCMYCNVRIFQTFWRFSVRAPAILKCIVACKLIHWPICHCPAQSFKV